MVELVDTADLKSAARLGRDGSSPSEATISAEFIGFVDPTPNWKRCGFDLGCCGEAMGRLS